MTARSLLWPLTPLYRLALAVRESRLRSGQEPVRRLRHPVISIGNLSTGGAGKTPFAIALARAFISRGIAVDVLSRGYGTRLGAAACVRPDGTVDEFGDEPLLIAREAGVPVYVAPQRYQAGLLAETGPGCRVHILDDAFQHRQLHRDIDILLLNREDWRDRLLPAGDLREPLGALRRANVLVIPDSEPGLEREIREFGWAGPVWRVNRRMDVPKAAGPVVAFCGIARPGQFFAGLEAAGLRLAARLAFPDHHRYTGRDLDRIRQAANQAGAAAVVTTAKDQVRLTAGFSVLTAGLRIEIQDEDAALAWLAERLAGAEIRLRL